MKSIDLIRRKAEGRDFQSFNEYPVKKVKPRKTELHFIVPWEMVEKNVPLKC